MSNLIPPLLSSSPPPIVGPLDEDEDDEFGDFRVASNSYDCDDLSAPPSPEKELKIDCPKVNLDINCNRSQKQTEETLSSEPSEGKEGKLNLATEVNCNDHDENSVTSTEEKQSEKVDDDDNSISIDDVCVVEVVQCLNNSDQNKIIEDITSEIAKDLSSNNDHDEVENFSETMQEIEVELKDQPPEEELPSTDDDFGNFEAHFDAETVEENETFDDFMVATPSQLNEDEEDDFGDFESPEFGDFSSQPEIFDEKNAAEKSEIILKEIFPPFEKQNEQYEIYEVTNGNAIFDELKDVTETNALIYQWSKSSSQKMFFKALNIDTRNILYGPGWNSSMPKFAANLGLTPLEPIKPEILMPTPVQNVPSPSNSSQKMNGDIPTAQFDWSGSGLVNPLDSPSTDPPTVSTDTPAPPPSSDQSQTISDLFDACAPEKPPQTSRTSPKLIPLRETHIFSDPTDPNSKPGWLQPTILTPDLPRKPAKDDQVADEEEDEFEDFQMAEEPPVPLNLGDLSELEVRTPEVEKQESFDEEFTEFHSSVPEPEPEPEPVFKTMVPLEPLRPVQNPAPVLPSTQINWPDPGVSEEDIRNIELAYSRKTDEDEWSDFVSVTNQVKASERTATPDLPLSVLNLGSVHAPKQPIPVITASGLVQTKLSTNVTSVVQTKVEKEAFRAHPLQPSIISSQFAARFAPSAADDEEDDWSDFVSSAPAQPPKVAPPGWTAANIIMNPTHHFQTKVVGGGASAMPDLDFITPTWSGGNGKK